MESSTNLGRVSLVPRGAYDPSASYDRLDLVVHEGSSFLVLRSVQGVTPVEGADYMLLAAKGAEGAQGAEGKRGPEGAQGPAGQAFTILGYYDTREARSREILQQGTQAACPPAGRLLPSLLGTIPARFPKV